MAALLLAPTARADEPTIVITSPAENAVIEVTVFPHTIDVEGTIQHTDGQGNSVNLCAVSNFKVRATDDPTLDLEDWDLVGEQVWNSSNTVCANETEDSWSFPYTIEEPGEYTIRASGKHQNAEGDDEVVFSAVTVIVSYPAAPSVAARMLADADIPARYGSGKSGGNHIADVAHEMNSTPGTDFRNVPKIFVSQYAAEVEKFLGCKVPAALPPPAEGCPE